MHALLLQGFFGGFHGCGNAVADFFSAFTKWQMGIFLQAEANINFLRAAGVSGGEFYRFHDKFPRPGMGRWPRKARLDEKSRYRKSFWNMAYASKLMPIAAS